MRVHISKLQIGDRLRSDIYSSYGVLIASANKTILKEDIVKFAMHSIDYIDIISIDSEENTIKRKPSFFVEIKPLFNHVITGLKDLFYQAMISGKVDMQHVENEFVSLIDQIKEEKDIVSLLLTLTEKDSYTYQHCVQVGILSYYIAKWMGKSEEEAKLASKAGYLHDIGKSKISAYILNKPSRLSDEEYKLVKQHTEFGYEIIKNSINSEVLSLVALQHHERLNGTGYPLGLTSNQIHPISKIVAVADVYSAMISRRTYKHERDLLQVLEELNRISFGELDPKITQIFIRHMVPNFIGKNVSLRSGERGKIIMTNQSDFFRPLIQIGSRFIDLSKERTHQIETIYM